jgi:hypothetical protein
LGELYLAPSREAWPWDIKDRETGDIISNVQTYARTVAIHYMEALQADMDQQKENMEPRYTFSHNRCSEKPFGFGDIQKGDTIKRTRVHSDKTTETLTGIADSQSEHGSWFSSSGVVVALSNYTGAWTDTYELVERPEPPKEYVVVRVRQDGSWKVPLDPMTLQGARQTKQNWDGDIAPRLGTASNKIMKLVPVDEK